MVLGALLYLIFPDFCTSTKNMDLTKNSPKPNTWKRYEPIPSVPIRALVEPGQCQFHSDSWIFVPLLAKVAVSPTSFVLRFGLPDTTKALNLSTCSCLLLGVYMKKITTISTITSENKEQQQDEVDKEELVIRPYTPISTNVKIGFFDLLIKVKLYLFIFVLVL